MEGKVRGAKRFYGLAFSVDPEFGPAERNIRRLYELSVFGSTCERVDVGDVELRRSRQLPEKAPGPEMAAVAG